MVAARRGAVRAGVRLIELAAGLVPGTQPGMLTADCCVFAEALIEMFYGCTLDHEVMRIYSDLAGGGASSSRVWGPVLACDRVGIIERAHLPPKRQTARAEGRWHICQGWTVLFDGAAYPDRGSEGHTWLWREEGGRGIVLDSARARGVRLLGWRTWAEQTARYKAGAAFGVLK